MQRVLENITIDDDALVRQCRQGDSGAMHRLIVKYQDRIYNVILKICGNRDDAAELTQETFVKLIENIETFKGNSSFYTWLFRIAVNLTYNHCKRRVKLPACSLDAPLGGEDSDGARRQLRLLLSDDRSADPVQLAQSKEVAELIVAALGRLDEDHRIMIVLRDVEGMAYAEIAEALSLELGTVKSRISRARAGLRDILTTVLK